MFEYLSEFQIASPTSKPGRTSHDAILTPTRRQPANQLVERVWADKFTPTTQGRRSATACPDEFCAVSLSALTTFETVVICSATLQSVWWQPNSDNEKASARKSASQCSRVASSRFVDCQITNLV